MEALQRYELIRPILNGEKSVKEVHHEAGVPIPTLYRYLKRFREGNFNLESLLDKSHAPHSHPHWFTEEQKDKVVWHKVNNPEKSTRQIAHDLSSSGILQISYHSVSNILNQRRFKDNFF